MPKVKSPNWRQFCIHVQTPLHNEVVRAVNAAGCTKSEFLRRAVKFYLKHQKAPGNEVP
jgi:hypothetical protein